MCLNIRWWNITPHKAKEDIVVYKMLRKRAWKNNTLMTPHRDFDVTIGETYTSRIERRYSKWNKQWTIERGIHSLVDLKTAIKLADEDAFLVAECIIPKGSLYYAGIWEMSGGDKLKSYASNCITYVKLLT
jgi:hypothetical protein